MSRGEEDCRDGGGGGGGRRSSRRLLIAAVAMADRCRCQSMPLLVMWTIPLQVEDGMVVLVFVAWSVVRMMYGSVEGVGSLLFVGGLQIRLVGAMRLMQSM